MMRGLYFPGCGAQYAGMGKELYDAHRVFQDYFEEASDCLPINFVKLCFASSEVDISSYDRGPLALLVVELACAGLLREAGIKPDIVAGADMVSWYASLHAVGSVTLPDALYIINKWIEMATIVVNRKPYGTLFVEGAKPSTDVMLKAVCDQGRERGYAVQLAAVQPRWSVVVGEQEGLTFVEEMLQRESIAYTHQDGIGGVAFALPEDEAKQLQVYLEKIDFRGPSCPVIDSGTGDILTTAEQLRAAAREMCARPARTDRVLRSLESCSELICSIPSSKIYEELSEQMPKTQLIRIETTASFARLQSSHVKESGADQSKRD